jgi:hypothetical protein
VVLAAVIGHAHDAALPRLGHVGAVLTGLAASALAVVPIAAAMWPNVPMTVRPVVVPAWFTAEGPRVGTGQVVLPYPTALGGIQSSMAWQAVEGLTFSMVGGGGPGITPSRAGPEAPGFNVLARASLPLSSAPLPTAADLRAIRAAMTGWGVTMVVVPDQPAMPTYDRGRDVAYAVALLTAALGRVPTVQARAWVWTNVGNAGPPIPMSAPAFAACKGGSGRVASPLAVANCVVGSR